MPEPFVWVHDTLTGQSGPVSVELAELEPHRYHADWDHPVRDTRGDLLDWKSPLQQLERPVRAAVEANEEATE